MHQLRPLVIAALALLGAQALAQTPAPTVAVLPVVNATGEKWVELRQKLEERLTKALALAFSERGFQLVDPTAIQASLDADKIDLKDEEFHRRDTLYKVAGAVKAKYSVLVVLTHNTQRKKQNFFTEAPEGEVTIKYWLVCTDPEEAIFSAKSETAKARPHAWLGVAKGSDQQLTAADRVIVTAFKEFLDKFPLVKKKGG